LILAKLKESIVSVAYGLTPTGCEVETGQVRVALTTEIETAIARETLRGRRVEVERVPVNQTLPDEAPLPQSREEGDTLVIPVVEEVAVLVKRLVIRE